MSQLLEKRLHQTPLSFIAVILLPVELYRSVLIFINATVSVLREIFNHVFL